VVPKYGSRHSRRLSTVSRTTLTPLASGTIQADSAALAFDGNGVASAFWDGDTVGTSPGGFVVANPGSGGTSSAGFDPQIPGAEGLIAGRDGRGQVEIFCYSFPGYFRAVGTAGAWMLGASTPSQGENPGTTAAVAFGAGGEVHFA